MRMRQIKCKTKDCNQPQGHQSISKWTQVKGKEIYSNLFTGCNCVEQDCVVDCFSPQKGFMSAVHLTLLTFLSCKEICVRSGIKWADRTVRNDSRDVTFQASWIVWDLDSRKAVFSQSEHCFATQQPFGCTESWKQPRPRKRRRRRSC